MNDPHTYAQLDAIFPYICFAYGAVMTFTLSSSTLVRLADERLPAQMSAQWKAHRGLALVCLVVGAAWVLQNLWLA